MDTVNLVSEWIKFKTADGSTIKSALDDLNAALGLKLTHSRLNQYTQSNEGVEGLKRPYRRPSIPIINYMMTDVLGYLLKNEGLSATKINDIVNKVTIIGD